MKTFVVLLLSLGLNVALIVALKSDKTPAIFSALNHSSASNPAVAGGSAKRVFAGSGRTASNPPPQFLQWKQINTDDLPELVRRLHEAGFPAEIVNEIIAMRVTEIYSARRNALGERTGILEYWKSPYVPPSDPKNDAELSALAKEQSNLLTKLLGPGYRLASKGYVEYMSGMYGDLPVEKLKLIEGIASDYETLTVEAVRTLLAKGSTATKEDHDKISLINRQMRNEIATLLTPEETREMQLRDSPAANWLRTDTRLFRTTEAEFLALLPIYETNAQRAFSSMAPRQAIEQSIQSHAEAVLGPARYAEYQQARNPEFDKLNRIVQRLDLPVSTAIAIATLQKDTIRQADAIRGDQNLTPDQRATQISALTQQASLEISRSLGPGGFEAYKQYSARWLQSLTPRVGQSKQ